MDILLTNHDKIKVGIKLEDSPLFPYHNDILQPFCYPFSNVILVCLLFMVLITYFKQTWTTTVIACN